MMLPDNPVGKAMTAESMNAATHISGTITSRSEWIAACKRGYQLFNAALPDSITIRYIRNPQYVVPDSLKPKGVIVMYQVPARYRQELCMDCAIGASYCSDGDRAAGMWNKYVGIWKALQASRAILTPEMDIVGSLRSATLIAESMPPSTQEHVHRMCEQYLISQGVLNYAVETDIRLAS